MGDCNGEEAAEAAAVAVSKQQGLDECDEATAAAIRGAVPSDHNVVSVERRVKVTERSVLTVNGTQVSLEGAEGEAISAALLSGRMPDQDVINRILIKAGLILKPAKKYVHGLPIQCWRAQLGHFIILTLFSCTAVLPPK